MDPADELAWRAILEEHPRVAVVGGPQVGKTTLANGVTDRPVFRSDDFKEYGWDEVPYHIQQATLPHDRFVVEGVQVARALRKGLAVDAVVVLHEPYVARSKGQEAMAKGIHTVLGSFTLTVPRYDLRRLTNPQGLDDSARTGVDKHARHPVGLRKMETDENTVDPQAAPEDPAPPGAPGENGTGAATDGSKAGADPADASFKRHVAYEARKAFKGIPEAEQDFREAGIDIRNADQRRQLLEALQTKDTVISESEKRLRALEKRAQEAEARSQVDRQRAEAAELRDFALKYIGDVYHKDQALAALGLGYVPTERLVKRDGRYMVVDAMDVEMHYDPADWVRKRITSKELDFLVPVKNAGAARPPPPVNGTKAPEAPRVFRDVNDRKRAAIEETQRVLGKK